VSEPSAIDLEMAIENRKKKKQQSLGTDQIPAELIKVGVDSILHP
jgi:hypothetical protein